jgi:hypothetical protein
MGGSVVIVIGVIAGMNSFWYEFFLEKSASGKSDARLA